MILAPTPESIDQVAARLRAGGIAAIPTETVYGLAANALDPNACAQVFAAKERPTFDPLIVHLAGADPIQTLEESQLVNVEALNDRARAHLRKLAERFWPGPLTLVLPKTARVPDLVTSGLPSVAIRFPSHPIAQAILKACGKPLAAPSANRFGRISPTRAEHVLKELGDRVDLILDGGPCQIGLESTVLRIDPTGGLELLRPGKVSAEEISQATGQSVFQGTARLDSGPQVAPGMLASHYAPTKKLRMLSAAVADLNPSDLKAADFQSATINGQIGLLVVLGDAQKAGRRLSDLLGVPVRPYTLSPMGNLNEAAQNLFAVLREMDTQADLSVLITEPGPQGPGLAHAIRDRLTRASSG
jgi:L-threonylcarbamoyladenylate synthase